VDDSKKNGPMQNLKLKKITDYLWEIPKEGKMQVPARI